MSKSWRPPLYTPKGLQNQWINNIFQSHDLFCGCPKPFLHLKEIIEDQKCDRFTEKETTTETTGIPPTNEDNFDEGDLQQLFEAEKEEEKR